MHLCNTKLRIPAGKLGILLEQSDLWRYVKSLYTFDKMGTYLLNKGRICQMFLGSWVGSQFTNKIGIRKHFPETKGSLSSFCEELSVQPRLLKIDPTFGILNFLQSLPQGRTIFIFYTLVVCGDSFIIIACSMQSSTLARPAFSPCWV